MSRDEQDKLTYQAPVVMPLGELAKVEGPSCHNGGSASNCNTGGTASNNCNNGSTAGNPCRWGTTAGGKCSLGVRPYAAG